MHTAKEISWAKYFSSFLRSAFSQRKVRKFFVGKRETAIGKTAAISAQKKEQIK